MKFKCEFSWQVQRLKFLNDSGGAKCCIFESRMLAASSKSNLGCEVGCGLTVSFLDHGPIMLGSTPFK